MNIYLVLIIVLLVAEFALDSISDYLNVRNSEAPLPAELSSLSTHEQRETASKYLKRNVQLASIRSLVFLALLLVLMLAGGFNLIDRIARGAGWGIIGTGLLFAGILTLIRLVLQLPFSIYDTFVIEEEFGFNRTTPRTFIFDLIKGLILGSILGGLVFAGLIYFFSSTGAMAWLYAWIAFTVFNLAVTFVAPVTILPLFNRFTPLEEGELRRMIQQYADANHFRLKEIFVMDSSRRSAKTNAFFIGFGRFRRLVLFDTLLQKHTPEEIVGIIAHEVGHFKRRHIPKSMLLSLISSLLLFFILSRLLYNQQLFDAFQMREMSVYAGLVFAGILYSPVMRLLSILPNAISRRFEYQADEFSVRTWGHPEAMLSALKKLSLDNLSNLTPHPLKVAIDYSHPPLLARIKAIQSVWRNPAQPEQ